MILRANELFLQYDYLYQRGMERCPIYSPRDVIVVKEDDGLHLAIVLGAISSGDELRTDWAGMTDYDNIVRHATWADIGDSSIKSVSWDERAFTVSEVAWYRLDKGLYAFDTYQQCLRFAVRNGSFKSRIRCVYDLFKEQEDCHFLNVDFVVQDLLEYFREEDKKKKEAAIQKYGYGYFSGNHFFNCNSVEIV